jgi:hypothetical protein
MGFEAETKYYNELIDARDRIRELEQRLAELQWREITEQDLPNATHEVGGWQNNDPDPASWDIVRAEYAFADQELTPENASAEDWAEIGMTHFRPSNAPDTE